MRHLPTGPAQGLELRLSKHANGSKDWHQLYNLPQYGLLFKAVDLSNRKLIGYGYSVSGFILIPLAKTPRIRWSLDMAVGVAYITKPFDYQSNFQNIAIGSHVNAFLMLGQRIDYDVTKHLGVSAGISFNHYSNGGTVLPNLGLNFPTVALGLTQHFGKIDSTKIPTFAPKNISPYWELNFNAGINEGSAIRQKYYPVFSLIIQRNLSLGARGSLMLGANTFYNFSHLSALEDLGDTISVFENVQLGPHIGYQLHIDELLVSIAMGMYIYDNFNIDGRIFNRISTKYYLNDWFGINLSLKTHLFKADFIELGTTFRL